MVYREGGVRPPVIVVCTVNGLSCSYFGKSGRGIDISGITSICDDFKLPQGVIT